VKYCQAWISDRPQEDVIFAYDLSKQTELSWNSVFGAIREE
jgi:hypothetical protein